MPTAQENQIEQLLAEHNAAREPHYGRQADDRSGERSANAERPRRSRKLGKWVVAGVVVTGLVSMGGFAYGVTQGLGPHIDPHAGVAKGGHASVKEVSMVMPPITLSTAETDVTGEKVAFEEDFKALGFISVPINQQTITRQATVETLITLNPNNEKIGVSFDSDKNKLTYTLPDGTLKTKVGIPTGKASTSDTSGSITTFTSDMSSAMANSISGMFGNDASSVPLLGEVAKGKTSVTNALTSFADLAITTGVDQKCTPLIEKIPTFTDQLKENIKKAMAGAVMSSNNLPELMNKPGTDIQKIIKNATVEMHTDYKIAPDQTNLDTFNKYLKSKIFSVDAKNVPPVTCGIDKDIKLKVVEDNKG